MTSRLCAWLVTNWVEADGVLLVDGMDLLDLSFDRAINVVYSLLMRNKDEKARAKLESEIVKPLPGEKVADVVRDDKIWGDDAQGAAFMAAFAGMDAQ